MAEVFSSESAWSRHDFVASRVHCAICARRLRGTVIHLEEDPPVSGAGQSWLLCWACASAVGAELDRSPLRSLLRTRVAVAIVASERSPLAHPKPWSAEYWDHLSDAQWNRLVVIWIWLMIFLPPIVFVLSVLLTVPSH
jgi:hypothetical protein